MELLARYDAFPACGDILVPQGVPTSNPAAPLGLAVAETATAYRSRHPEQTAFYQLFDKHFDDYVYAYEERFEAKAGPLRSVVRPTVEAFLDCGRLYGGFARIRCPSCRSEHLLAFSCQTRNFCPSCQAKRSVLFAEKLQEKILQPVPHRHYAFSIPKVLRGLLERERSLLSLLSQTSYQSILQSFQELFHRKDVRPGSVTSIQTFGSFAANFNPHCHNMVTEGVFTPQGEFVPLPTPATYILPDIEERFRKLLLKRLHRAERLSETFMNKLLEWNPSGFSVHAEQLVYDDETQKLENLALYLTRAPIKLSSITQTPEGQVCVTTPPHPLTGNTDLVLDVLDWIHAICQQILPWAAPSKEPGNISFLRSSPNADDSEPRPTSLPLLRSLLQPNPQGSTTKRRVSDPCYSSRA